MKKISRPFGNPVIVHAVSMQGVINQPFSHINPPSSCALCGGIRCKNLTNEITRCSRVLGKVLPGQSKRAPIEGITFWPIDSGRRTRVKWRGSRDSAGDVIAMLPSFGFTRASLEAVEAVKVEVYVNIRHEDKQTLVDGLRRLLVSPWSSHVVDFLPLGSLGMTEDARTHLEGRFIASEIGRGLSDSRRPVIELVAYNIATTPRYPIKLELRMKNRESGFTDGECDRLIRRAAGFLLVILDAVGIRSLGFHGNQHGQFVRYDRRNKMHYGHLIERAIWHAAMMATQDGLSQREGFPSRFSTALGLLACGPVIAQNRSRHLRRRGGIRWLGPNQDLIRTPVTEEVEGVMRALGLPMVA
jgi:hypothetical protein